MVRPCSETPQPARLDRPCIFCDEIEFCSLVAACNETPLSPSTLRRIRTTNRPALGCAHMSAQRSRSSLGRRLSILLISAGSSPHAHCPDSIKHATGVCWEATRACMCVRAQAVCSAKCGYCHSLHPLKEWARQGEEEVRGRRAGESDAALEAVKALPINIA